MNNDINLVSPRKISPQRQKTIRLFRVIAVLALLIVGSSSILLFILNAVSTTSSLKKEQDEVLVSIASQNEKAVGLNVVKERSGAISDILKSRVNYNEIIDLILSKKPIGLPTTSLSIDKDSVSITVSSLSLLLLNEYLSELVNISLTDDRLSNLSVETLSANQSSGEYSLSIKALLNGPKN